MVKGISRQVIVVRGTDPKLFEQAIFILREDAKEVTEQQLLKEAKQAVEGELDAYFEPKKDCEDYSYSNGRIDLREAIEDAIMAAMPYVVLCDDSCEGIQYSEEKSLTD